MWRLILLASFSAVVAMAPGVGLGQTIDPHAIFEERCSRCHSEHSAGFARKSLALTREGTVVGTATGKPVARFLEHHPGNPSATEIAALVDMFSRQIRSGGLFLWHSCYSSGSPWTWDRKRHGGHST